MKKTVFVVFITLLIIAGALGLNFHTQTNKPYKGYPGTTTIEVKRGSTVSQIVDLLYDKQIIPSKIHFKLYYRLFYNKSSLKTGEYLFDRAMTIKEIIEKLHKGKVILYKITIKEGMTIRETAEYLHKYHNIDYEKFMNKAMDFSQINNLDTEAKDLEGYLYPDTYLVPKRTSAEELVQLMVKKFRDKVTNNLKWRARDIGFSIREVITLASLIEKETSAREERFLISSVFHNRLKIGMPMGCDPTIIYALKRDNIYRGKLGWKELKYKSPYNTRLHRDLPPGPICSPGFASIEAALFPENTKFLYFVAKDHRSHYFSKTLREHNQAVRKYIINKKR